MRNCHNQLLLLPFGEKVPKAPSPASGRSMNEYVINILLFCILFIFENSVFALPSDKQQPMHIVSNYAHWDGNLNTTTLIGNVIITQGTTIVTADKVIIYSDKQNKMKEAIATGDLATYTTVTDLAKPKLHAMAQTIQYSPQTSDIVLIGQAHVQQGDNSVTAPRLNYNMAGQTVDAPVTHDGRTTIVIQPQQINKMKADNSTNSSNAKSTI